MELIRQLDQFPDHLKHGALTIGNFDGVHRGHACLIKRLKEIANDIGGPTIVFTFDPHPVRLLRPEETPPPLTWTRRKADLLRKLGVDAVVAYPTNLEMLFLTYQQFFNQIICQQISARAMVEGPNFYFGKDRAGNVQQLSELCQQQKIVFEIVDPTIAGDQMISSSRIRNLIRDGSVGQARECLTEPYRIRGMVTHGAARGSTIGFPTANLDAIDTLVPKFGVYAGRAYVDNHQYWAAIHIGPNPTFKELTTKVEVHIVDFDDTIYGQVLEVDFVDRIRDVRQFDSSDELVQQLQLDVQQTRRIADQYQETTE